MALVIDYRSPLSTYRVYPLLLPEILIFISLEILMTSERVRGESPAVTETHIAEKGMELHTSDARRVRDLDLRGTDIRD